MIYLVRVRHIFILVLSAFELNNFCYKLQERYYVGRGLYERASDYVRFAVTVSLSDLCCCLMLVLNLILINLRKEKVLA